MRYPSREIQFFFDLIVEIIHSLQERVISPKSNLPCMCSKAKPIREAKYLMMKGRIMFLLMGVGSSNPGRAPPFRGPARVQAVK